MRDIVEIKLSKVDTEYVAFLDADDVWHKNVEISDQFNEKIIFF